MKKRLGLFTGALLSLLCLQTAQAERITVSAAASLKDAFQEISKDYKKDFPTSEVDLNFAGSGTLLQQISRGAPVDVFASADQHTMNQASEKGLIDNKSRHNFAQNKLIVIAPIKSSVHIDSLEDLISKDSIKRIAISNPETVPVGRYTKKILEQKNIWSGIQPKVIRTQHVRQSLDYVARGEVDVGFVYSTDGVIMKDKVKTLFPVALEEPIIYPIAAIRSGQSKQESQRFIDFVLSPKGQNILKKYGFSSVN